jgi:hypothetical protein
MQPNPRNANCNQNFQTRAAPTLAVGKEEGGAWALRWRFHGALNKFGKIRVLTVARRRFSRVAHTNVKIVPQLARDISRPCARKNIFL